MSTPTLETLFEELREATTNYNRAAEHMREASRNETDAINRLNKAQAAVDKHLHDLRTQAPSRSDWKQRTEGHPRQ